MFTKKKPLEIKKHTVTLPSKPKPAFSNNAAAASSPLARHAAKATSSSHKPRPGSLNGLNRPRTQQPSKVAGERRPSPATPLSAKRKRAVSNVPDFGTDDGTDEEEEVRRAAKREQDAKRRKQAEVKALYRERKVRSEAAFAPEGAHPHIVHAALIPSLDLGTKYEPYWPGLEAGWEVQVQYPSLCEQERFQVARAPHDSQGYDPFHDISETMHKVIEFYLPEHARGRFADESTGYPQRLHRALKKRSQSDIQAVLEDWNTELLRLCQDGPIRSALDTMMRPDPRLVEWIINQTHARTVSLNLKALHEYEAGTDNVYGELLPKFVSKILEDTMLGPDAVFVDLGSGVGNVTLQAALEAGCESWGCEMMEKYCDVADLQQKEFVERCCLWGFSIGDIHLERGDFLANTRIHAALRRADVVLVNNQVFTPQTNDALTTLFLDLKDGCRVVSLKSFVPAGHRINVRNSQSPYSILGNIREKEYFSKSVSWTDQGGKYFISTKDQSFLTNYNANGE